MDPQQSPPAPLARGAATSTRTRAGFTLTELLVVITIISILAALVSAGVFKALDTAKQTRIKLEADGIDSAFKSYKEKYGSYPPCDLRYNNTSVLPLIRAHVARAFPRYNLMNLTTDLTKAGVDGDNFRPDQALVFWLQGFSPDPANPFIDPSGYQIAGGMVTMAKPTVNALYAFDKTRLWQVPSIAAGDASAMILPLYTVASPPPYPPVASYYPSGQAPPSSTAAPFLYWEGVAARTTVSGGTTNVDSNYGRISTTGGVVTVSIPNAFNTSSLAIFSNAGIAVPYWNDSVNANSGSVNGVTNPTESWVNNDSFQILSAGLDGKYGTAAATGINPRCYPTGGDASQSPPTNYDTSNDAADDDNVTNFNSKARLSDAKP